MKLSHQFRHRFAWINLPGAVLIALLQRTPVLNLVVAVDDMVASSPAGAILKAVVATAASLGALNTLAGATPLVPSTGTAAGITVNTGTAVSVFYTVNGTQTPPMSWTITGSIPPGLNFSGLAAPGTVNIGTLELSGTPTTAGTYDLTLTVFSALNGTGFKLGPYAYAITVNGTSTSPPSFTTQPQSQTVTVGAPVTFTAAAGGSPTYQWQKDGANLAGATTASYTIASVAAGDAGTYVVVATNSAGSVNSSGAVLTVNQAAAGAPAFTAQPTSTTASAGSTATFTVGAGGSPAPTYQWQRIPAGGSTWVNLKEGGSYQGTTSATLTVRPVTTAMSGDQFDCVLTNASGSTTSNTVVLTVSSPAAALLQYPVSLALDSAGNLFVADASANTILKISPAGVVSTVAGAPGMTGSQDGTGAGAMFNLPGGVAMDGGGNVFVADTGNSTIRKITSAGVVTTFAGSPTTRGSRDGVGTAAQFNQPVGLAIDPAGNLYVADTFNATIRKIASDGTVTTLAGTAGTRGDADGTGAAAQFNHPDGIAVDGAGNVYVADTFNDTVRKITPAGVVSTLAGSAGIAGATDLAGANALFNQPAGIAVDGSGNVLVADTANATIRRLTPAGAVTTLAGTAGVSGWSDTAGGTILFNQPRALVTDGAGDIFVADSGNGAIRKIAANAMVTTLVLTAASTSGSTPPPPPSTPPTLSSGSGTYTAKGVGGMEAWFVIALTLLGAARAGSGSGRHRPGLAARR